LDADLIKTVKHEQKKWSLKERGSSRFNSLGIDWDGDLSNASQEPCLMLLIGIGVSRPGSKLEFAHFLVVQRVTEDAYPVFGSGRRWARIGVGSAVVAAKSRARKSLGIFERSKKQDITLI
jgi:hypothetical protein